MGEREYAELTRLISQMIQENASFHGQRKQELTEFRQEVNERLDKVEKRLASLEERTTNVEYQMRILNTHSFDQAREKAWDGYLVCYLAL